MNVIGAKTKTQVLSAQTKDVSENFAPGVEEAISFVKTMRIGMREKMKRNRYGIHIGNTRNRDFESLLRMGVHNYTALHHNVGEMKKVREKYPNALILCRFYHPAWSDLDPEWWANKTAETYKSGIRDITKHVTPANEMNLPNESGGWSKDWYARINSWLMTYHNKFRGLCPDAILHFPALAFGHDEREYGYDLLKESLNAYDVIDYHVYWREHGRGLTDDDRKWYATRFDYDHKTWFPTKPVFISECGNFSITAETTPAEFVAFFEALYDYPYILGATPFIWDSGDEHRNNRWMDNIKVARVITKLRKREVEVPTLKGEERLVPRSWGWVNLLSELETSKDSGYTSRQLEAVDLAVIHHTGGNYTSGNAEAHFKAIARYHVRHNHWPGIGYHYGIDENGVIYWLGPAQSIRWHAGNRSANRRGIGIVLPGDFRTREVTDKQRAAVEYLLNRLDSITGNRLEIQPHDAVRDGFTECPGNNVKKYIGYWRGR